LQNYATPSSLINEDTYTAAYLLDARMGDNAA